MTIPTLGQVRRIAQQIAGELRVTGPCNIQLLHRDGIVKVIECNLRASRSLPFVSKVTGRNYARAATRIMLGADPGMEHRPLYELEHVGVKVPQFSFSRLMGADPLLGVEMASTGEVGCLGDSFHEALLHGLVATGFRGPKKGVLLSLGPPRWKHRFVRTARTMAEELGLRIYATSGTCRVLRENGIDATEVARVRSEQRPLGAGFDQPGPLSALDLIDRGEVDLVVNVPVAFDPEGRPDGYLVRRPRRGPGRAADYRSLTGPARGHRARHPRGGLPPRPRLERLPGILNRATAHRQSAIVTTTAWSAGLRPASRGSAKPGPMTLCHAKLPAASFSCPVARTERRGLSPSLRGQPDRGRYPESSDGGRPRRIGASASFSGQRPRARSGASSWSSRRNAASSRPSASVRSGCGHARFMRANPRPSAPKIAPFSRRSLALSSRKSSSPEAAIPVSRKSSHARYVPSTGTGRMFSSGRSLKKRCSARAFSLT